ncbi:MAG: DASS family sodium-coupled anion symporter [Fimbriimonadaceae bacterium]|nr:DASS family sodium-coupled anion symporter [Fimbriimonadaceae bacterium]
MGRASAGLRWLGPIGAAVVAGLLLRDFGPEKAAIGALFAFTVGLWMSEVLPVAIASLLSTCLLILTGRAGEEAAFAAYGDPIVPLFIGSFILAKAMEQTGLSDRFAYRILQLRWTSSSPQALLLALGLVPCVLSLLVSNTATTAMMLPIGLSVLSAIGQRTQQSPFAYGTMLMLTWGSSVAVGLPVGTPPNLIGLGMIEKATSTRIGFGQWMAFAMPITALSLLVCWGLLLLLYGKANRQITPAGLAEARELARAGLQRAGAWTPSERVVIAAFGVALVGWALPDLAEMVLSKEHAWTTLLKTRLPASVPAVLASVVLFAVPCRDRESGRAIDWREASQIDWGTILLFAAGIALGKALFASGLAKDLGTLAAEASGARDVWAITALCIAASIVLSELASNTAAATTLVPVAIGLSEAANVSPIPAALGVALGASFGFMLPVSTAPNAIVYSSGLVPARQMLRAGILLDIVSFFVIFGTLRLVLPMIGLA